jgi:hypothetical protein
MRPMFRVPKIVRARLAGWFGILALMALGGFNVAYGVAANDNFINRIAISATLPATVTGNNNGASIQASEPDPDGLIDSKAIDNTLWYSWTPTTSGRVIIDTQGSTIDTLLGVYLGFVFPLGTMAENDDYAPFGNNRSRVDFYASSGVEYKICVDGFSTQAGDITINITESIWYVDAAAAGSNDGTSWANAYTDLQSALSAAVYGDKIWVKAGTYKPTAGVDCTISFSMRNGVDMYGGFAGTETALSQRTAWGTNATILDGDLDGDGEYTFFDGVNTQSENSFHVVQGNNAIIDGFTIRNGCSLDAYWAWPNYLGAGMYNNGVSPTVRNCAIVANRGGYDGCGVYNSSVSAGTFENCTFYDNVMLRAGMWGGGMVNYSSTTTLKNCVFASNSSANGGGYFNVGGSTSTLINCTFYGNNADNAGGGLYFSDGSPVITNCIVYGNTASTGNQIYASSGSPSVNFCDVEGGYDGSNNIDSLPLFVNAASIDGPDAKYGTSDDGLRLQPASPCIGAGTNFGGVPPTDLLGIARPTGAQADMGAFEGKVPKVSFQVATASGGEASGSVTVNVTINAASDLPVAVSYAVTGGTATAGTDFTLANGTLNWAAGNTANKSFNIALTNDVIDEDGETIVVTLDSPDNSQIGTNGTYTFTVNDNDTAGFTINATDQVTDEAGGTGTFTVRLNTEPTANVTFTCNSNNSSEGTVNDTDGGTGGVQNFITFTSGNWNTNQTITITGVNDSVDDDNVLYTILNTCTSGDAKYNVLDPIDVQITNNDNDTAAFIYGAISGNTTEAGGAATFTVKLATQPLSNVTVNLTSTDTTEGTVTPSLTFTGATWSVNQTVTVTGAGDFIDDGNIAYSITSAISTADSKYSNGAIAPAAVAVSNTDDDTAGVIIQDTGGTTIATEGGSGDIYRIKLASQPTVDDVTIDITPDGEVGVSPTQLTFTTANWNTLQAVSVSAVDDFDNEASPHNGVIAHDASSAGSAEYNNVALPFTPSVNVTVGVTDNDTPAFTFSPVTSASVTISLQNDANGANNDPITENANNFIATGMSGGAAGAPATGLLTISGQPADAQTVVIDDGPTPVTFEFDSGGGFGGVQVQIGGNFLITAQNLLAAINAHAFNVTGTLSTNRLDVSEAPGTDATFTVVLTTIPTDDVVIDLSSSDVGEGTIAPAQLTFTAANWNDDGAVHTVTVTGVADAAADGDQPFTVLITGDAGTSDADYLNMNPNDVYVVNRDIDSAGVSISQTDGSTTVEEGGATDTYTVVLNTDLAGALDIAVVSIDVGDQCTVNPSFIIFDSNNWNVARTVTVTAADDAYAELDLTEFITHSISSSDPAYNGIAISGISVDVRDDDVVGINVAGPIEFEVGENGTNDSFTVALNSRPTADVTLTVASSDTDEATVDTNLSAGGLQSTLTFTGANWATPQTVRVASVDDDIANGDGSFSIDFTGDGVTADVHYNSLTPGSIPGINLEDDTPDVDVSVAAGDTTEGGGSTTFTIVLESEPTAQVDINLSSTNTAEGTLPLAMVSILPGDWATPVVVTIDGEDDDIADGDQSYEIVTVVASGDPEYDGINADDVDVVNEDDDEAGVTVSAASGNTTEAGVQATFTIVLDTQPFAQVAIGLSSTDTDEGTIDTDFVEFDSGNWNVPQTVTITGIDDLIDDGDVGYTITTANCVSTDPAYAVVNPGNVIVTNTDDDVAGITVSAISNDTTEAGATATFDMVLTSKPTFDVNIGLSSDDLDQGTVLTDTVTFTTVNWNVAQTVTVQGADGNSTDDGDVVYAIVTAAATSADTAYNGMDPSDVALSNLAVNNTPTLSAISDITILEDAGLTSVNLAGITVGQSGEVQVLTVTASSDTIAIIPNPITVTYSSPDPTGSISYTPVADANGLVNISVEVSDDGGQALGAVDSFSTSYKVTITAVNDVPSFTKGADDTVLEDSGLRTVAGWATAISKGPADESGQVLTFACANDNNSLFSVQPSVNSTTGDLTFTPAGDARGSATVTISISDDGGTSNGGDDTSADQTFTITVTAVNDVPSFTKGADQSVLEDAGAQTVNLWATAISAGPANEVAQVLTFTCLNDNNPLFSVQPSVTSAGNLAFTPALNANGLATVTITLADSGGVLNAGVDTTASQTFTITVTAVNDVPSFTKGADQTVLEESGAHSVGGWATAISKGPANEAAQVLTFSCVNDANSLFSVQPSVDSATGDLTYTLAADANGPATVTITLADNGGTSDGGVDTSASQTFTITVTAVNDVPSFTVPVNQTVLEDCGAQTFAGWVAPISAGPANESGQVLTFTCTNDDNSLFSVQPSVTSSGQLSFTPTLNDNGTATVTISLADNGGTSDGGVDTSADQTFTITVTSVNDSPIFNYVDPASRLSVAVGGSGIIRPTRILPEDGELSATDVETIDDNLILFNVLLAPGQGNLFNDLIPIQSGEFFTQQDVIDGSITYSNLGGSGITDGFAFQVEDEHGGLSALEVFKINIDRSVPAIDLDPAPSVGDLDFAEDTTLPFFIGPLATVDDDDSPIMSNGLLTVGFASGYTAGDEIKIENLGDGTSSGDLVHNTLTGILSYNNGALVPIGIVTGGINNTDLQVSFYNSAAPTLAAVQTLVRRLCYFTASQQPTVTQRVVQMVLADNNIPPDISAPATRNINVIPEDDAPIGTGSNLVTPANVALSGSITVQEVDGENLAISLAAANPRVTGLAPTSFISPTTAQAVTFLYTPGALATETITFNIDDGISITTCDVDVTVIGAGGGGGGGGESRPWITSDPPVEIEEGGNVAYVLELSLDDYLPVNADGDALPATFAWSLVGDLTGITASFNGGGATLTAAPATSVTLELTTDTPFSGVGTYVMLGIVVTDATNLTVGFQKITVRIVPAGWGSN